MKISYILPVLIVLTFLGCKKDLLGGFSSKTYVEESNCTSSPIIGTCSGWLEIKEGNKAGYLSSGDIVSSATYSTSGKTLTVKLENGTKVKFEILSVDRLKEKKSGSIWAVR